MKLSIISDDPIQSHVLLRLADRAGWSVSQGTSLEDIGHPSSPVDAVVVDVERLDTVVRRDLRALAARVGRERVFLLTEQLTEALPTPAALGVQHVAIKPVDLADFIRLVGASVPARSAPVARPPFQAGQRRTSRPRSPSSRMPGRLGAPSNPPPTGHSNRRAPERMSATQRPFAFDPWCSQGELNPCLHLERVPS